MGIQVKVCASGTRRNMCYLPPMNMNGHEWASDPNRLCDGGGVS